MNTTFVCEKDPSLSAAHQYEDEIARRWWALPLDVYLPLSNGDSCQLLFAGRPGGSLGPDVRDAIVRFTDRHAATTFVVPGASNQHVNKTVGDVEIHIRATDWFTHQHHTDTRYNNVILHVVLICDDTRPTLRQDGSVIPICSLYDLLPSTTHQPAQWPCHHVMARMNEEERTRLLAQAGILRFEQKTQAFFELLRAAQPSELFSAHDVCLIPALAEALGYGRDRAFFRAAGLHLIGSASSIPEPLGRTLEPSPLDASRLRILHNLVKQWRTTGAWQSLCQALLTLAPSLESTITDPQPRNPRRGGGGVEKGGDACVAPGGDHHPGPISRTPTGGDTRVVLQKLRNIFDGLGKARTDILICNVVLPFAAAVAQRENDTILATHVRNLYVAYPGLPSNQVTRAMSKQLLLKSEPKGACQQQGLHFIYTQTCREKRCIDCMLGKPGDL